MSFLRWVLRWVGWSLDRAGRQLRRWGGERRVLSAVEVSDDDGVPEHWLAAIRAKAPWLLAGRRLRPRRFQSPPEIPTAEAPRTAGTVKGWLGGGDADPATEAPPPPGGRRAGPDAPVAGSRRSDHLGALARFTAGPDEARSPGRPVALNSSPRIAVPGVVPRSPPPPGSDQSGGWAAVLPTAVAWGSAPATAGSPAAAANVGAPTEAPHVAWRGTARPTGDREAAAAWPDLATSRERPRPTPAERSTDRRPGRIGFGPAVWAAEERAADPISGSGRPPDDVAIETTEGWPELPEASPIQWQTDEIRMPLPGWNPRDRLTAEQAGSSWSGRRS